MRVGLVGCGRIAERGYVPAFSRADGVELAAVVDLQSERCRTVAPGVAAFADVGELVASGEVDAVVVATPVGAHVEVALEAAEAGLATLVEKPPARSASEVMHLLELEPDSNEQSLPRVGRGPFRRSTRRATLRGRDARRSTRPRHAGLTVAVESPRFGRIGRAGSGSGRSGGHTDDAFALLVPGRSRLAKRQDDESVVDVTATACALLGADMSGLAGTPLLEPAAR